MRGSIVSALMVLVSGCTVVTASGTEEAVLFSPKESSAENPQAVLKPHNGLPMSIEFACPTKIATMSTSIFIPVPPVIPVGVANKHVSYLRVRVPEDAEYALKGIRIIAPEGTSIPLPDAPQTKRAVADGEAVELTYALQRDCEDFDGGALEVAGFSYKNRNYPASVARLRFDSKIRGAVGPGLV